jgi:pimeloyl-ACP methyl ester carboxylesterase
VIIVHGIWMNGAETWLLARRLGACGFRPLRFSYPSLRSGVVGNAGRLARFVRAQGDAVVHLVGHSLGGLVILRALLDHPGLETGRVVLLGSPVNGSLTARRVQASRPTRWLLGRNADEGLLAEGVRWGGTRSLGVIAGRRDRH